MLFLALDDQNNLRIGYQRYLTKLSTLISFLPIDYSHCGLLPEHLGLFVYNPQSLLTTSGDGPSNGCSHLCTSDQEILILSIFFYSRMGGGRFVFKKKNSSVIGPLSDATARSSFLLIYFSRLPPLLFLLGR
ncbi:hypothetical protein NPIL_676761 [Nephila pilipes]|uniref:Uncharacterized protein n=1 Tax=Nephila pilipes TaxID=299642 RepID=A0A8X6MR62_NEPPI|nr:hypothetical protein NPIL_676761 [Nephila pilipes]